MEMSVDDDEEYWANEDFIATIEDVVKKAEEASAARHGGTQTQSGAPTSHSSAIVPPQTNNLRVGEVGPSAHGTPREAYSCPISGHREAAVADSRGIPAIDMPQSVGRNQVSVQSMDHQGQASVHAPRQSLREVPTYSQSPRGPDGVGQLMAERDGMIAFLRSRVQEADQQCDELRRRVGSQYMSHPSLHQQQLELERLSAQLLFKDHEIIEGQRARAEKEERLKDALAETAALKEELEKFKKSRQIGPELKRTQNEADIDVLEHRRSPPWMPDRISEAEGNTPTGFRSNFLKDAYELEDHLAPQDKRLPIEALKMQTEGHGGASLDGKESPKSDKLQTNDNHNRDMWRRTGASTTGRSDAEEPPSSDQLNNFSRTSEMYFSLRYLWGLNGVRNDHISLLCKLYSSCRQDLYILFSNREPHILKSLRSAERGKEGPTKGWTISEKLHTALAKVSNGLANPEVIITPLLEFCRLENAHLVGSALHVLRCILQHDSTCRRNLLLRDGWKGADCQLQSFSCKTLEKEKNAEDKGWYVVPNEGSNLQTSFRVMFSSPRILVHPQEWDNSVQHIHDRRGSTENGADNGGQEPPRASDQLQQQVSEHEEAGVNDTVVPTEHLNSPMKWMLQLALTSSSSNVKFEAITNIGVLVINSEPLTERSMFGPLLCHGALDLLLMDSSSIKIQLQALRIVQLLLHCPTIMQRFFVTNEGDENMMHQSKFVDEGGVARSLHVENQTGKPPGDGLYQGISGGQTLEKLKMAVCSASKRSPYTELSKVKLLEGLTECLKYTGNSPQGYALHRSVIRLLSFIVAFGESGAAALMQAGFSCEDPGLGKTCKDDAKPDGVVGEEIASGQHIIGDGSGSTHLKGQDLGEGRNGIPMGQADESVDYSERAQNIPQRLLTLIDSELDMEEREEWIEPTIADERDHLVYEAVTLLCRLSSDAVQSPVVIGHLISNKDMARLTLSVTNRLVSRKSHTKQPWSVQKPAAPRNSDLPDLARILRDRVLCILEKN